MNSGKASRTAQHMALFRAIESARPANSQLFQDPFATLFRTASFRFTVRLSRLPILRDAVESIIDLIIPGARSSAVARTRFIDDLLGASLKEIDQVFILGSGYNCRPYRISELDRLPVFEVVHPNTLEQKRNCLKAALGALPKHMSDSSLPTLIDRAQASL